jgi:hypothetical protein
MTNKGTNTLPHAVLTPLPQLLKQYVETNLNRLKGIKLNKKNQNNKIK